MEHFSYILILLSCTVMCIWACRKLHLPPIVGYLLVGVIIGPGGLKWLPTIEDFHLLAEFGVVFLMFTLGLEFSIPRLMATKKILFGVGGVQVLICTIAGMAIAMFFGLKAIPAFIIGSSLALSSTAIVIKQLNEQKEQNSTHGEVSINILLFQDLAAVLFLVLIPALSGNNTDALHITFFIVLAKGLAAIIGMTFAGIFILRPLFHEVAKTHSTELFMLLTLLVALSAAAITHIAGLSMALGAFMAGLMLGETEFKNQIEIDIRPFKDVLLGLFFVVIGAYLELNVLPQIWLNIIILLGLIIIIKFIVITCVAKFFARSNNANAFRVGLVLAHGGEFSFVLLREALEHNNLDPSWQPVLFSSIVLSALLSPLMIRYNNSFNKLFKFKSKRHNEPSSASLITHAAELSNHVILCGFGRSGQILSRFLDDEKIPWLALDLDPTRITKASVAGEHSFYGNASHPETLTAAGIAKARMVVITFKTQSSALEVLKHVRNMRLDLPVFIRTVDDSHLEEFRNAGATEVVPESLEGGILLGAHLLLTLGVPTNKVVAKLRTAHINRYENFLGFYQGIEEAKILEAADRSRRSLHSLVVAKGAQIIGQTIGCLLKDKNEVRIKSLTRDGERHPVPNNNFVLKEGDVIVALALAEEAVILEERIFLGFKEDSDTSG